MAFAQFIISAQPEPFPVRRDFPFAWRSQTPPLPLWERGGDEGSGRGQGGRSAALSGLGWWVDICTGVALSLHPGLWSASPSGLLLAGVESLRGSAL